MNKLILKTAIITLVSAIAVSVMAVCAVALLFPAKTARSAARLGMYSVSANFQEISYNRVPSVDGLGELVDYAAAAENYGLLKKYCPRLLSAKKFPEYALYRDSLAGEGVTGGYAQFVTGNYAVALYKKGDEAAALAVATAAVSDGYPENNAVQYLLYEGAEKKDETLLLSLAAYFTEKYDFLNREGQTPAALSAVAMDAAYIYGTLGEEYQTEYELWLSRV